MNPGLALSEEEHTKLTALVRAATVPTGSLASFESLCTEWATFVTDIERGYDLTIYDYTNDLCLRDILEKVVEGAPPALRLKLAAQLRSTDERYMTATEAALRPLLPVDETRLARWNRVPKVRVGELGDDLVRDGHVST